MVFCNWCGTETKKIYPIGRCKEKSLCPICAKKHLDSIIPKLENHIEEIQNGIKNRTEQLRRLTQEMCNHENIFNTGYCEKFSDSVIKQMWKCPDCRKIFYK